MKKISICIICSIVLLFVAAAPAFAAMEYNLSEDSVNIKSTDKSFTLVLTTKEASKFAGEEFIFTFPKGLMLADVEYDVEESFTPTPVAVNTSGDTYFGFFYGGNVFSGEYKMTLHINVKDDNFTGGRILFKQATVHALNEKKTNVTSVKINPNVKIAVQVDGKELPPDTEPPIVANSAGEETATGGTSSPVQGTTDGNGSNILLIVVIIIAGLAVAILVAWLILRNKKNAATINTLDNDFDASDSPVFDDFSSLDNNQDAFSQENSSPNDSADDAGYPGDDENK